MYPKLRQVSLPGASGRADVTSEPPSILLIEEFDNSNVGSRGWYDQTGTVDIVTSDFAGGGGCLRASFGSGGTQPAWQTLRHLLTATDKIYVSYWVKYSSNWVGSGESFQPHEIHLLTDLDGDFDGLSDTFGTTYIEHVYSSGIIPVLAFQDNKNINVGASVFRTGGGTISGIDVVANTETRSIAGANGGIEDGLTWENFAFGTSVGYYNRKWLQGAVAYQRNTWNFVEVYFAMNTISGGVGQHNGTMRLWVNKTIIHDRNDIMFRTNQHPSLKWKQIVFAPYIGDGSPVAQNALFDHLTVATGRPSVIVYPVRTVTVTPNPSSVDVGSIVQLTATVKDPQDVTLTGRTVTWQSSNGSIATVSASGLVTGVAAGSCTITATCEGIPGTSALTVSVGAGNYPNEPVGYSPVMEHDFVNDVSTAGWTASGLHGVWRDEQANQTYVNDVTAPQSPQRCMRSIFPSGQHPGDAPARVSGWDTGEFGTEMEKIYYSTRIKIEGSDFQNQLVGTKMGFWGFNDSSSAANQGFFIIPGNGLGTHIDADFNFEFWQQGFVSPDTNWVQNVNTSRLFTVGAWHHVEVVFIVNTIGSANGVLKIWIDGTQTHNYSTVTYRNAGHPKGFFGYSWNPTWGGTGGADKNRDDFMRQDHIYISGVAL